nr:putative ribonuclease H-like domain-containing protein [Tanacetum cinerariifolium]
MHDKFQMSAMSELNFFLGLQVLQKKVGIFFSQDKYVGDILKMFGYSDTIMATSATEAEYVAAASGYGQVLWIQNQMLDYGYNFMLNKSRKALSKGITSSVLLLLAFCDYHNMITILEKSEHNINFHQIVDFIKASHIRIKTTNEGTKILATVDGKPKTISESSIRRNLKVNDEEGSIFPSVEVSHPYHHAMLKPKKYWF